MMEKYGQAKEETYAIVNEKGEKVATHLTFDEATEQMEKQAGVKVEVEK